jgi:hypothetical protein
MSLAPGSGTGSAPSGNDPDVILLQNLTIAVIHEVTLHDLI